MSFFGVSDNNELRHRRFYQLRDIARCKCGQEATVQVVGDDNRLYGSYCNEHGDDEIWRLRNATGRTAAMSPGNGRQWQ